MNSTPNNAIAQAGDNNPPTDAEIFNQRMQDKHGKLFDRAGDLVSAASRVPQVIDNEEDAGKASDLIKMLMAHGKNLEAERVSEKEPYLHMGRVVDGFFKTYTEKLASATAIARRPLTAYLQKKEADERRRREEEAKRQREEAEAKAAAAAMLNKAGMVDEAASMQDTAEITAGQAAKAEQQAVAKPAELARSRSETGSLATLRQVWAGEIVDQKILDLEVLRHLIAPDALQKALNSYVKAGGRELRGARIFQKTESTVR